MVPAQKADLGEFRWITANLAALRIGLTVGLSQFDVVRLLNPSLAITIEIANMAANVDAGSFL